MSICGEANESERALWAKGYFNRIAESIGESGEELVARIGRLKLSC
jgi:hypothetical protein